MRNPEQTKQLILNATFKEVCQHGFQATSLDTVLAHTKLTKGALYHHYPNKTVLGYALIENVVNEYVKKRWIEPLAKYEDTIEGIQQILVKMAKEMTIEDVALGCPLNNLTLEMSSIDDGFRERLKSIIDQWSNAISDGLRRGQEAGYLRPSIDPDKTAMFLVASLQGCVGVAKNAKSITLLRDYGDMIIDYIDTLKVVNRSVNSGVHVQIDQPEKGICASGCVLARMLWQSQERKKHNEAA